MKINQKIEGDVVKDRERGDVEEDKWQRDGRE